MYVAKPTYSRNEKMEYVNVRYISKLCTQPQKFINELYVRANVQQFVEPCLTCKISIYNNIHFVSMTKMFSSAMGHYCLPVLDLPQVVSNASIAQLPGMHVQTQGLDGQAHPSAIPPHMDQMGYASPNYLGSQSPQDDRDRRMDRDNFSDYRRGMDRRRDDMDDRRRQRDKFEDDRRGTRRDFDRKNEDNYRRDRERDRFSDRRRRDDEMQEEGSAEVCNVFGDSLTINVDY